MAGTDLLKANDGDDSQDRKFTRIERVEWMGKVEWIRLKNEMYEAGGQGERMEIILPKAGGPNGQVGSGRQTDHHLSGLGLVVRGLRYTVAPDTRPYP